jgi:hypothetical protein
MLNLQGCSPGARTGTIIILMQISEGGTHVTDEQEILVSSGSAGAGAGPTGATRKGWGGNKRSNVPLIGKPYSFKLVLSRPELLHIF